jgi:ADP-ribosyl-[dinitrogen reductase] hydrolase
MLLRQLTVGKIAMDELNPNYEDRFIGSLVGLAIGDALGCPLENKSRAEIAEQYGSPVREFLACDDFTLVAGHYEYPVHGGAPGSTTEDTHLALLLAESIVRTGGKIEPLDFGPFMAATVDSPYAEFLGRTTRLALSTARLTGEYQQGLTTERSAGNGVAVRNIPVGLLHVYGQFSRERLQTDCEKAAYLTHRHPVAVQAAVAVAAGVRAMCRREIFPEDLMAFAIDMLPPGYQGLALTGNPLRLKLDVDLLRVDLNNMERCGTRGYAPETVAAAFFAFVARKDNFEEALTVAVNAGGDTDTIAAITGALAGAYHGLSGIPERWRKGIQNYEGIVETARALHKTARARELTDFAALGI